MKQILLIATIAFALTFGSVVAFGQEPVPTQEVPFAPFSITLSYPDMFGGGTFVKELPFAEAVSVATAVTDKHGTLFYVISLRDAILDDADVTGWSDLETVTYRFFVYALTPSGGLFQFCWGTLPLKSYVSGLMFDSSSTGRLMLLVRTLAVNEEECGFLILDQEEAPSGTKSKSLSTAAIVVDDDSPDTGSWDLSGLEQCFYEKLSIVQISGQFDALPQIEAPTLND